jgi:hypothetical protein
LPRSSADTGQSARVPLPSALRVFCWTAIVLTVCSVSYTYFMSFLVGWKYPYGLPFFQGSPAFWDLLVFQSRFAEFHTERFWGVPAYPFTYPAPLALVFGALYALPGNPVWWFLGLGVCVILLFADRFSAILVRKGLSPRAATGLVLILIGTNWGIGYLMNRTNIEGVVVILVSSGIICFVKKQFEAAAVLFGIAGAMKIFPFVYMALLLSKRRYKDMVLGIAVSVVATVASLKSVGPSTRAAWIHISDGLTYFKTHWAAALMPSEIGYDHSLFTLVKWGFAGAVRLGLIHSVDRNIPLIQLRNWGHFQLGLTVYTAITALCGIILYFYRIRHLPLLNQILVLAVCSVLLPPVSFDYTLVHLVLPFALLCIYATEAAVRKERVKGLTAVCALFAMVFCMNAFFTYQIRFAGQVRAVAMLLLLILMLRHPFNHVEDSGMPAAISSSTS